MKNYKSKSALKHFIVTAIFAAMCQHGAAQTTKDVAIGLTNPSGLHINGTNLYVAQSGSNIISKIDLDTEAIVVQFTGTDANFAGPRSLASKGNDLYIAVSGKARISKIDIGGSTPSTSVAVVHTSVDDLHTVESMVFDGNILYATARNPGKIVKIDNITATTLVVSDLITGITSPRGLLLSGTDLYVASGNTTDGKLSKIDLTEDTPVAMDVLTGLNLPTFMVLEGNNLYISENGTGKILKIDISETTLTSTEVLTGLTSPQDVAIYNGYLYVTQAGSANKIVKYLLPLAVVSTNTFSKDNYRLFPNPVSDVLFVKSESKITSITISSLSGQEVLKSNSESINVRNLSNGIYFARIVSREKVVVEKFLKL